LAALNERKRKRGSRESVKPEPRAPRQPERKVRPPQHGAAELRHGFWLDGD
jgi:hypothetical protein